MDSGRAGLTSLGGGDLNPKYRKLILTLVVRETATELVRRELDEAANLISTDNIVYECAITDKSSRKPANAAEYDVDDE
jgi:hypothetical protein